MLVLVEGEQILTAVELSECTNIWLWILMRLYFLLVGRNIANIRMRRGNTWSWHYSVNRANHYSSWNTKYEWWVEVSGSLLILVLFPLTRGGGGGLWLTWCNNWLSFSLCAGICMCPFIYWLYVMLLTAVQGAGTWFVMHHFVIDTRYIIEQ